jgi:hypothetical protein
MSKSGKKTIEVEDGAIVIVVGAGSGYIPRHGCTTRIWDPDGWKILDHRGEMLQRYSLGRRAVVVEGESDALFFRALAASGHTNGMQIIFTTNYDDLVERTLSDSKERPRIAMPPVHALVAVGSFLLSRAVYLRYIEPFVDDIRCEYFKALQEGNKVRAAWVVARGYGYVLRPLLVGIWRSIVALVRATSQ